MAARPRIPKKYYQQANDIYKRLKPFLNTAKANAGRTGAFDPDNLEKGLSEMHKVFTGLVQCNI